MYKRLTLMAVSDTHSSLSLSLVDVSGSSHCLHLVERTAAGKADTGLGVTG